MKKIRHRRLMRLLMKQNNGSYAKSALWLQTTKTYGDGTYGLPNVKCETCGNWMNNPTTDDAIIASRYRSEKSK